jgi:hypothetical protein
VKDDVAKHLCNTIVTSRRTIGPDPPPYQGVIQRPEDALQHGFWAPGSDADPRSYSFLVDAGSEPLTDMLLKSQPPVVYEGKKQVHGVECMVVQKTVQGSSKESYLFDAAHGFLVRRRELSTWLGGKWVLVAETDVPRVIESGGVWLPESIESKDRLSSMLPDGGSAAGHPAGSPAPGGVEKGSGMVGPMETAILVTISDFRANCDLPPEAFVLDWPLGTVVSDNIHHKRFIVTTTDITPK